MPGYKDNVSAIFSYFDFLIIPSLTEGLPITLLEALRAKLPVIATKVGGIPNVLEFGACGLLVEPGNVEALSAAINELAISDLKRRRFSELGYFKFRERYDSSLMAKSYMRIYSNALKEYCDKSDLFPDRHH
jgi:glycosyltransferase involved in cell wall biosynthesis